MTLYRVTYHGNNSGGYWWTSEEDGVTLLEAGWLVPAAQGYSSAPFGAASFMVEAEDEEVALTIALSSWYQATALDPDDQGCNCCGPPHRFEVEIEAEYGDDDPFDYRDGVE